MSSSDHWCAVSRLQCFPPMVEAIKEGFYKEEYDAVEFYLRDRNQRNLVGQRAEHEREVEMGGATPTPRLKKRE